MKTKIVFEQIDFGLAHRIVQRHDPLGATKVKYRVVSLVNRTVPHIGDVLGEEDVKKLIAESVGLTVEVKPGKKRR